MEFDNVKAVGPFHSPHDLAEEITHVISRESVSEYRSKAVDVKYQQSVGPEVEMYSALILFKDQA